MDPQVLEQTRNLLKAVKDGNRPLMKAGISTSTGLNYYDLEAGAKLLYPVITPFRNTIPRVKQEGYGLVTHWKQITGVNTDLTSASISEGKRGAVISVSSADKTATYKGIGLENSVNFEAEYGAMGFEDVKALAVRQLLEAVMIEEEKMILFGNAGTANSNATGVALGATQTPTCTPSTTGGVIAAGTTLKVWCVALTYQGYLRATIAAGVPQQITKTNADGTTDTFGGGAAQVSAASGAVTTTGATSSVTAKVTAVAGAVAYAWFYDAGGSAASAKLTAITTVNKYTITGNETQGTQKVSDLAASDYSGNALEFDGVITQAIAGGCYTTSLDGATMTADGFGGVVEIDTILKYLWDTYKISPSAMIVGSQVSLDITKKVLAGSSASPSWRINVDSGNPQGTITAGSLVTSYLNKFSMRGAVDLPIILHPNMPPGMIFFDLDYVPYPNSNVPTARRIKTRREYYQIEWPLTTRQYPYGVYADELLQVYVPFGMALMTNIAAG